MNEDTNTSPENEVDDEAMRLPEENLVNTHHAHMGPILGTLIIVLVLILGGLYLWGAIMENNNTGVDTPFIPVENNEPETTRAKTDVQILQTMSSSDELSAIEADLDSTNLDTLDADLLQAENELETTQ